MTADRTVRQACSYNHDEDEGTGLSVGLSFHLMSHRSMRDKLEVKFSLQPLRLLSTCLKKEGK